jgi:adenylate cyclase
MPTTPPEKRVLAAFMFTDLVGYSALAQRNEALALELLAESQRLLRAQFPIFHGREVKSTGDGFLAEFPSALQATQCAVEIQKDLAAWNRDQPEERQIRVRIGLHVGEAVHRENDLYGDGVNVAARIEPLATGGGICVSDTVFAQVRNKLGLPLLKLDAPKLKHIEVPMDVYRVVLPWEPAPPPSRIPSATVSASPQKRWAWQYLLLAAGALALSVGIILHLAIDRKKSVVAPLAGAQATNAVAAPDKKSVAVLPFVNLSAEKSDEYLSDGMTEELLNVLARLKDLRVPGRASSFAFKGRTDGDIFRQVGQQLHVATVLEGSVRRAGEKLRVTAQLINVADGFLLWSEEYNGDMKDIFAFQSDVAQEVVQKLALNLGIEESRALTKPPTANAEANRRYLLGRYHFAKGSFSGFTAAIPFFEQAIQLDTNFALAYCGLADAYGFTSGILRPGKAGWAREAELAKQALALDPGLAEAHFSLGLALASSLQWEEGEKHIKRAIEMNPNMAVAYDQYAFLLTCVGRHDEAIAMSRHAVELEPLSPLMNIDLGWWLLFARHYDEALAQCRKAVDLDERIDPNSNVTLGHWALGWSLLWKGEHAEAVREFELARQLEPEPFFEAALGYAYGIVGERAKAEQILRELGDATHTNYASPGLRAYPSLGLGQKAQVFDWLNQSVESQDYPAQFLLVDPAFDGIRSDARFELLLKQAGLKH